VKLHLRSDVKVGVALSGGIDSTSILSMISEIYPDNKIYTFSYISDDKKFSEEKWVDIANKKNNTISKKVEITANQFESDFESIMEYLGEPFGSASFYSSYRVYKLAAENGIKVILDGQGGDEILGGYFGYLGEKLHSLYKFKKLQCFKIFFSLLINSKYKILLLREVLKRILFSNMFLSKVFFELKYKCDNTFSKKFLKKNKIIYDLKKFDLNLKNEDSSQRQIIKELRNSITSRGLPSLLRNADRMSMKSSIESRVPFLYEDLIEFMYKLPENFLVSDKGETKFIFKKAMKNILPFEILNRKDKIGFNSPDKKWIVQYLKNNMNSILEELKNFEMLNFLIVKKRIKNLIYKNSDLDPKLWRIINVLVWKKVFKQHIKV
jgi:asparagine synthase (glutamine-hydrolysing)